MPAGEAKEKNMVKSRMIVLAQMFYEHTDQDHPMTGQEILEYLKEHAENHKRYVKSWAKAITNNPNCLVQAVKSAEIATDFLELHGGLIDISTFNSLHGHDVTVFADKENHIKVSFQKQLSDNNSISLETHNSICGNTQSQSRTI